MVLDFVIIPVCEDCLPYVENIIKNINSIDSSIKVFVDTNYRTSVTSKINKYKKTDKDIIIINSQHSQNNTIKFYLFDNEWQEEVLSLEDFFELLQTKYDENADEEETTNEDYDNDKTNKKQSENTNSDDNTCIIM